MYHTPKKIFLVFYKITTYELAVSRGMRSRPNAILTQIDLYKLIGHTKLISDLLRGIAFIDLRLKVALVLMGLWATLM
jgi:hypothetical protein